MNLPRALATLLPRDTAEAWSILARVDLSSAVLYGGTGLAAHIYHRQSRDLDFFLTEPADLHFLAAELERSRPLAIETLTDDTLNGLFGRTKIQVLYSPDQRALAPPVEIAGLAVAALPDLLATKLKVLRDRPALRDYFDLMAIEQRTPYDVVEGMGFYIARYGDAAERTLPEIVRALGYFDDVVSDPGLDLDRAEIVHYWQRRQPQVVAALGRG